MNLNRIVTRFVNGFTSQVARRYLRRIGAPSMIIPMVTATVREVNRKVQWGNTALWKRRAEAFGQFLQESQNRPLSPVYRFRGGSGTMRRLTSPRPLASVAAGKSARTSRFDSTTVLLSGLGLVVIGSIAHPMIAKKVNFVDSSAPNSGSPDDSHSDDLTSPGRLFFR